MVARRAHNPKVVGSNPALATNLLFSMMVAQTKYFQYAFILWVYTLIVILWGAWVRISHSGDGCGQSWPLCHGQVLPESSLDGATWIEFSHRVSTGLFGLAVVVLVVMAFKFFPMGHIVRKASVWTLFFTLTEALIGAKLVLSGLVGEVSTFERAFVMSIHQINSLLLTGSLAFSFKRPTIRGVWDLAGFFSQPYWRKSVFLLVGFLLLAIFGAISALSSTLFPSSSLMEGLEQDFQSDAHWLVRWRIVHPLFAILYIFTSLFFILSFRKTDLDVDSHSEVFQDYQQIHRLFWLYIAVLVVGLANLFALSPVILKLMHLGLVHILWTYLILFSFSPK